MKAQCCICSDLFVNNNEINIAATPCGHVFHEHCLARWLFSAKTCPSCRKVVNGNAIIPKLFFDVADDTEEADPDQLSNELQNVKSRLAELNQEKLSQAARETELKEEVLKKDDELETLRILLQQEQDRVTAMHRLLRQHETKEKVHEEEKASFVKAQRKLAELRHIEALLQGDSESCEEIVQQCGGGDHSSTQQLAKYTAILKREYEQAKVDKRQLKEQLEQLKKLSYTSQRDADQLKRENKSLQEQLAHSEEDLKQAEKTVISLKAKLSKLKRSRAPQGESAGSFLETPTRQETSDGVFVETPKLSAISKTLNLDTVTPVIKRPQGSGFIDLDQTPSKLDQSFDLFEESPRTQVRKACEENNIKVVKISSAATSSKAQKRVKVDSDDVANLFPLSSLNIMKKRERTGQLLGKTLIRQDYNGFGGTSNFIQPLGVPKFSVPKRTNTKWKKTKSGKGIVKDPSLPTLDSFIDLT